MVPTEETAKASEEKQGVSAPTITLPKGGGAIRGMGEKFTANPVTGTGAMSIPIATSPGRSGFGPGLSLTYDSGAGNGPFGLGWNLSLPSITRKTDKGLPKYQDAIESDIFILSGAEDLVPVPIDENTGMQEQERLDQRTVENKTYNIQRYRPRIEGLFARIERWTNQDPDHPEDIFWRSISKDNITTWYGKTEASRIFDPSNPAHIFSWLICESYDDKGNVIAYQYTNENTDGIDLSKAHEQNRTIETRQANRYLNSMKYGNLKPYLPILTKTGAWPTLPGENEWMFEVVLDYGDHDTKNPLPNEPDKHWPVRNDPFSSYRAGFEVRTYRLCQRVLMFHHFRDEPDVGINCLVRSTDFTYSYEENPNDSQNPVFSYLLAATQTGYKRKDNDGYLSKSLPPLEFKYSPVLTPEQLFQQPIRTIECESLENLPYGLDGSNYQWMDLDGEGLYGILTEQADGWFYKRNLSANHQVIDPKSETAYTTAHFGVLERVATKPNITLAGGQAQFLDLAGDGQTDLVVMEGPLRGFYERTFDEDWESFRTFSDWPHLDTRDPNLKFIDLTGDGHADILISEDRAFVWHASLAEAGFAQAQRVQHVFDEEKGPRLIFADGTQSIYLADLSGDGLTDLVRIRNGEVCYWPNLGYGRFGHKVTMDNAPRFDSPNLFDQRRIRLADIDGSGVTDILYLSSKGVQIYYNQSGNSWSKGILLEHFPRIDNLASIQALDLLGNGTACLVWSSPLSAHTGSPMKYIDLMGGQKPHLLITTINNLGAETYVQYAPSTRFYLQDKLDGKPWITKLPFPVHCVEKVTVTDKWRGTSFSTTYSYHHGYFDGFEREFRGFGRVDQIDVESYGEFADGNAASPYITDEKTLYQPPVKTITWYHTGVALDREHILSHFEQEYFPLSFEGKVTGGYRENDLPQPDLDAQGLSAEEWRETLRACKGMMLRQEVYELDVDELEKGNHIPVKLFTTAYHNCHIQLLQAKGENKHAVFLLAESEAITYHYELDLRANTVTVSPDPRIAHTLNLTFDEYANVLQSVAVVYPRPDNNIPPDTLASIRQVQQETHIAYTETRYTDDVVAKWVNGVLANADTHRVRVPCEVLTYELTAVKPKFGFYFTLDELRGFRLSPVYQPDPDPMNKLIPVPPLSYHQLPKGNTPEKRLVEHVRTLFFDEKLVDPLPLYQQGRLGLTYETYKLALTDALLDAVFKDDSGNSKLDQSIDDATTTARGYLDDPKLSGYLSGTLLSHRFPNTETAGQYWIRSGIAGFDPDAPQHFYLPERYTDPFGNVTTVKYGPLNPVTNESGYLFVQSSTDALGNTAQVIQFDYRVLAPSEMQDINGNLSEVYFDDLGLPCVMALTGQGHEGDNLDGFNDELANAKLNDLTAFFVENDYNEDQARIWLDNATARHIYYFGETEEKLPDGKTVIRWGQHPACACSILRETHVSQLTPNHQSRLQTGFEYSDGMGRVLVKKIQAEPEKPGQPMRWVANGKTILNNKGKPVKQYEPSFCLPEVGHRFEEPPEDGVYITIYYDAVGRTVRTEMPDGSYSRVEFSPWHVQTFDPNDTAFDPDLDKCSDWYDRRMNPLNPLFAKFNTPDNVRAAKIVEVHSNTPSLTILDSLGRNVVSIVHNRVEDAQGELVFGGKKYQDELYLTFTKLDTEGKPLWIKDARGNLVMQYVRQPATTPPEPISNTVEPTDYVPAYDIAGNLLFQHSMDAGDRWMLNDAAGKPMIAWDSRGHMFRTEYDELHRSVASFVKGADANHPDRVFLFEKTVYGDTPNNGLSDDQKTKLNLRGKPYQHFDTAGVVTSRGLNPTTNKDEAYDFKGNSLRSTRQLITDYKGNPDWSQNTEDQLESETFTSSTRFDALNRPIQVVAPHSDRPGTKLNIIQPGYNEANLLEGLNVWTEEATESPSLLVPSPANAMVRNIDYNAKGQRILIQYGNDAETRYRYDPETFRLIHLYTRRGVAFTEDCDNPNPPPPTIATPEEPPKDKPCGLQNLHYTYDPVGNITAIRDDAQDRVFHSNACVKPGSDYVYDPLYRLIAASGREHKGGDSQPDWGDSNRAVPRIPNDCHALRNYVETYRYDAVGNILQMLHSSGPNLDHPGQPIWNREYQYATDSNRLLAIRLPGDPVDLPHYITTPGYTAKYTYDEHGNMIAMPHLPMMEWDFKDQLHATQRQVVNDSPPPDKVPETTYYVYDAGGQRIRKVTETQNGKPKDERIYLGVFEVYRKYENQGQAVTLERETLHIMDDKQRVALVETRTVDTTNTDPAPRQLVRYQFGNHLGSAVLELDDRARVISYEEYHPYGSTAYQAMHSQTETPKRYRYTGKERDEETGLYYHGARYYAAWLGRWVNPDPMALADGTNVFVYVSNEPVLNLDPYGTDTKTPENQSRKASVFNPSYANNFKEAQYDPESDSVVALYELPDKSQILRFRLKDIDTSEDVDRDLAEQAVYNSSNREGVLVPTELNRLTVPRIAYLASKAKAWKSDVENVDLLLAAIPKLLTIISAYGVQGFAKAPKTTAGVRPAARISARVPLIQIAQRAAVGQIANNGSDLAREAIAYRVSKGATSGNIAVAEFRNAEGKLETIRMLSGEGYKHAEVRILEELKKRGIDPKNVERIYSELAPCTIKAPGANCASKIAALMPNAKVTYSFPYGSSEEARKAGVDMLKEAIKGLIRFYEAGGKL